ncbi:MAG: hypothetical protein AABZ74_16990 [Cyanobacteriota bacterium]
MKKFISCLSAVSFSISVLSCSSLFDPSGVSKFGMKAVSITKISNEQINVQTKIKWDGDSRTEYYELYRIQDGIETKLGGAKITKSSTSFTDPDAKTTSKYKYKVFAIDSNNKTISKAESDEITPFSKTDIQAPTLSYTPTEKTKVSRDEKLKWNAVEGSKFYYPIIRKDKDPDLKNIVLGAYTKETMLDITIFNSPVNGNPLTIDESPIILKNGLEAGLDYKFSVYSIKTNPIDKDLSEATAIIMSQSKEVTIGL